MSSLEIFDPRDDIAKVVTEAWINLNQDRRKWLDKGLEARRYVTASSTNDTEVGSLGWKNKTTIPKLTQIADNLQSYYMAALMPSEDWFRWEGFDRESQQKAQLIEAYMSTKLKMGGFRKALEQIIRDWIIYGNCFAGVTYTRETTKSLVDGSEIVNFVGPRLYRISPLDCVIDPKAPSFDKSVYIRRRLVPIVDILQHNEVSAEVPYEESALEKIKTLRGHPDEWEDFYKDVGYEIDGFGTFDEYLDSQYIELLDYWGDIYVQSTGEVLRNQLITIADRSFTLRRAENPSWNGRKPFAHSGWRILPDNLYGQGPLDNLVGMQYRCDHLENLKADAFDQIIHPIVKVKGNTVEDFKFGPGEKIFCGDEGDVDFLRPDAAVLQADNQIALYHNYMEIMAGSPRESMGFRTPGEKTAFEVEVLVQGADRMFQDKLNHLEEHLIEPILNLMFETMIRNLDTADVARVFNDDTNALLLTEITREDVVANGTLKPVGSKHFAARNKRIQELQNFLAISQNPLMSPHISGINAARMFEEELGFEKYALVEQNIGVQEQIMTQFAAQQFQQQIAETVGQAPMPPDQEAG